MPNRFGYLAAASSETFPEFGSQPGGCKRQALTPAASMSRMHSSAVYEVTWRCDGLVGGPADQMWTWASTISMAFPPLYLLENKCRNVSALVIPAKAGASLLSSVWAMLRDVVRPRIVAHAAFPIR